MPTSTFRNDVAIGVTGILATYQAAHPTLIRSTARRRPSSLASTELPCAYLAGRTEKLDHDSGTRSRDMLVAVEVADTLVDSVEAAERMDVLVDGLLDAFTAAPHGVSAGTVLEPVGAEDDELPIGQGAALLAIGRITLRIRIMEGRS